MSRLDMYWCFQVLNRVAVAGWWSASVSLRVGFCVLALASDALPGEVFKPGERFLGMLASGEYVHDDRPRDWHAPDAQPKLAGRAVFDGQRPFRWVIDQAVTPEPPPRALLEFYGGDTLPGRVIGYEAAAYDSFEAHDEYLVVEPSITVDRPGIRQTPFLRIRTRWLKRVVFERKAGVPAEWRPGTAFLHDGRTVRFRRVRWAKGAVAVLTADGVRMLLHSQIIELHLPERSGWEHWFEQLAVLSPDLQSRLLQIDCGNGLRLTASTSRYRAGYSGDSSRLQSWHPLFHPAWSLDPLTIPFSTIRVWRFFAPTRIPATLFEPVATRDGVMFSSGWKWQRNVSVQKTALISGGQHAGWGFGTHAPTRLSLPLHEVVTAFRTRTGLDRIVRSGGSARTSLAFAANPGAPVWRSGILVGSDATFDSGWQTVSRPVGPDAAVLLIADPLTEGRPRGSDPFDIRDCVNWIEPEFQLDPEMLQAEVARRRWQTLPALHNWRLTRFLPPVRIPGSQADADADTGTEKETDNRTGTENATETETALRTADAAAAILRIGSAWNDRVPHDERFETVVAVTGPFAVFTRRLRIGEHDHWLGLAIDRPQWKQPAPEELRPLEAIIRLDGRTVLQQPVPQRSGQNITDPITVPLTGLQNRTVRCDVILFSPRGTGDSPDKARKPAAAADPSVPLTAAFAWHGAMTSELPPGIAVVFDENREFADRLTDGEGRLDIVASDAFSGSVALKVAGGERSSPLIGTLSLPLREYPRLGEFRYLRFAWKKADGDLIRLSLGHDGLLGLPELAFDAPRPRAARQSGPRQKHPRRHIQSDDRGARYGWQYDSGPLHEQPALRMDRKLPTEWRVHTRDLFSELGAFTLTGLGLSSQGGGAALFDQIYLARTQADFDWIATLSGSPRPAPADANILEAPRGPRELGQTVARFAPQFSLSQTNDSVVLLREFAGRSNVLRTHPRDRNRPAVFRSPVSIRTGKITRLHIGATHHPDADWELLVRAAGEDLLRQTVSQDTVSGGWLDVSVDLSRFAGQNIMLEVLNRPTGWRNEFACWSRLEITEQSLSAVPVSQPTEPAP